MAVIVGFEDMATIGDAIDQRGGHFATTEDGGPFVEAEVGGDDDAGAIIEFLQAIAVVRRVVITPGECKLLNFRVTYA